MGVILKPAHTGRKLSKLALFRVSNNSKSVMSHKKTDTEEGQGSELASLGLCSRDVGGMVAPLTPNVPFFRDERILVRNVI